MNRKLFYVSGLGADERAFERLPSFSGYDTVYIRWIQNKDKETLENYCKRLIDIYKISNKDTLLGLSFGGLVSQKIAELVGIKDIFLISSFRNKSDLKWIFRLGLTLKLYKMISSYNFPVISNLIAYYLNSSNRESKSVLKAMLRSTDMRGLKWSIEQIDKTQSIKISATALHVFIGDNDKIVNLWKCTNLKIIQGGSHFMVYDKATELSCEFEKILCPK